jgi:hypothetical protein
VSSVLTFLLYHKSGNERLVFLLFAVRQSVETEAREGDPTAACLTPLMAMLAVILVTGAFSSGFDWFYAVRVLGTAAVIWFFWRSRLTLSRGDRFEICPLVGIWSGSAILIGVAVFVIWLGLERVLGNTGTGLFWHNYLVFFRMIL